MMSFRHRSPVRRAGSIVISATLLTVISVSAPAEAVTATKISYKASAAKVYAGSPVTLSGRVVPAKTSRTVYLLGHYAGGWHIAAKTKTIGGAYKVTMPSKSIGTLTYRLVVLAGAGGTYKTTGSIPLVVVKAPYAGNPRAYKTYARWNPCSGAIGYRVNLANMPAGAFADVKGAIARIHYATGLNFVYRGTTAILPQNRDRKYPADTRLVIAWARPGQSTMLPANAGVAGVGGAYYRSALDNKGRGASMAVKGFVVLDSTLNLARGFGSGPVNGIQGTLGQLVMHEVAHAMGLQHPDIDDKAQIMYPMMVRKVARWGAGDKNGLRLVGRSKGCFRS